MEYVHDSGIWSDFPHEKVVADFTAFYPPELFADTAPANDSRTACRRCSPATEPTEPPCIAASGLTATPT